MPLLDKQAYLSGHAMHFFLCFTLALGITLSSQAMAADAPAPQSIDHSRADERFKSMDTDTKGFINFEDFQKRYPNMQRPAFDSIDADKNGRISLEEWRAFFQGHSAAEAMPPGRMPPPGGGMGGQMPPPGHDGERSGTPLILPPAQ
jgi:hypothetical protein